MFNPMIFNYALIIFIVMSVVVLLILTNSNLFAPYGKMTSNAWGSFMVPARLAWIIMESPAPILSAVLFFMCDHLNSGLIVLFCIWQFHYFYRSFIFPFLTRHSKAMPISMMFSSLSFQIINLYFQAGWLFVVSPKDMYADGYLQSPNFIIGFIVFLAGTIINRYSDHILRNLRKPNETEYKIPYGGLYKFISCPNYLGEIMIWLGWAILLKSWVGVAFFMWTVANLVPRALVSHKWYQEKFTDYPIERKAIIPGIL